MRARYLIGIAVVAILLAACGESDEAADTTTTSRPTTTSSMIETTTSAAQSASTSTSGATTTTAATGLPGDPATVGPGQGTVLAVIGVAYDDVLNLRRLPGPDQQILDGIPPTFEALVALGETRTLPAYWTKVDYEQTTGWVHLGFVGVLGGTTDITSYVLDQVGGSMEAATMTSLGAQVADVMASEDPPSRIVVVVEESTGDLGEVTYDVVGLGDDAVRGLRLHVFGEPGSGGYDLRSVESTALCDPTRGVDEDGYCA